MALFWSVITMSRFLLLYSDTITFVDYFLHILHLDMSVWMHSKQISTLHVLPIHTYLLILYNKIYLLIMLIRSAIKAKLKFGQL